LGSWMPIAPSVLFIVHCTSGIAFGIAVSTILGPFVIPIYYVLGERLGSPRSFPTRPSPVAPHDGERHIAGAGNAEPVAIAAGPVGPEGGADSSRSDSATT
jgi:hypothetical protein